MIPNAFKRHKNNAGRTKFVVKVVILLFAGSWSASHVIRFVRTNVNNSSSPIASTVHSNSQQRNMGTSTAILQSSSSSSSENEQDTSWFGDHRKGGKSPLEQVCQLVCQQASLSQSTPGCLSVESFWKNQQDKIREAMLHSPANVPFGKFTNKLANHVDPVLQLLAPSILQQSIRSQTYSSYQHPRRVARIMSILWERYQYLQTTSKSTSSSVPPRLQVLVLGGSATIGSNCKRNNKKAKMGPCAWPGHLEYFINAYLGFDAVQIVNYGIGGTTSDVGILLLDQGLLPTAMQAASGGPDIIINAYAVNDFHLGIDRHLELFEEFVNKVNQYFRSCAGDRPLLIYLDDIVNNFFHEPFLLDVVEERIASVATMANWYRVPTVGYTDVARDVAYRDDTAESLLLDTDHDGRHPTWYGHVAIVLTFIYNAIHSVIDTCERTRYMFTNSTTRIAQDEYEFSSFQRHARTTKSLTGFNGTNEQVESSSMLDESLKPSLRTKNMTIKTIVSQWKKRQSAFNCHSNNRILQCAFSWVAMLSFVPKGESAESVSDNLTDIAVFTEHWKHVEKWPPYECGLFAQRTGATILFRVPAQPVAIDDANNNNNNNNNNTVANTTTSVAPINTIRILYLKSYSERWEGSLLRASVYTYHPTSTNNHNNSMMTTVHPPIATLDLSGFHTEHTSNYHIEEIFIGDKLPRRERNTNVGEILADNDDAIYLQLKLIGGKTFRLGGLSFCHQER